MATDRTESSSTAEKIGPYRLQEPLGSGGMGTVWRAWDERLKRAVALKRFHVEGARVSGLRDRFRREAQAAARLNHPSIVHIYDLLEMEDGDWIVMELVEGRTLRSLLRQQEELDLRSAVRIGREIAEGLAEAHAQGILHRDLKTSNIMVTPSGRAKILDFGLAKEMPLWGGGQEQALSAPGIVIGTCHAMSPEQAQGLPLDGRSDLFSLGSLLYEILTGDAPFLAETPTASLARVLSYRQRPVQEIRPEVPSELSRLVDRLLEKNVRQRPESARDVVEALSSLSGTGGSDSLALPSSLAPVSLSFGEPQTFDLRPPHFSPQSSSGGGTRQWQLGERRVLTVVCCGLVGVDDASGKVESLDLEALTEAMNALEELASEVCQRLQGRPGAVLGHRLWLSFGHPQAHEDDPERGVRAAREIAERLGGMGLCSGPGLRQRAEVCIAVHTGPAVAVNRPGQNEQLQPGSTLEIAMGLQRAAPAGAVVVSAESRKLIAASFTLEPLPPARLPGYSEPLPVYRVVEAADPRERETGAATPLVGRDREVELLVDRFHLTRSGTGQMVMISGEPGIGKSRLLQGLRERVFASGEELVWLSGYASVYTHGSPLLPVIGLLERVLFPSPDEPAEEKLFRLEGFLRLHHFPLAESVPLFAPLLALPAEGRYPPPAMTPDVRRKKTLEALVTLFSEMAEQKPLVLVIEDLHWADPSTLELLGLLLDALAGLRLFLIVTFRPDFQAPWGHRAQIFQLALTRLSDRETRALMDRVAGSERLSDDVRQQIIARTDGIPLFIEELTKTVLEAGETGSEQDIPSTLNGSLMTRLDRLRTGKEVAQVASVIGRTFSLDLLAAVAELDREALEPGLAELLDAELVHRRGMAHRERYSFKHALIQDAAYASLLQKDRQQLHRRIAFVLEGRLAEPEAAPPEVIAYHATAGGDFEKAADFWLEAGQQASARFAQAEAIEHLREGLQALESLPPGVDRDRRELAFQSALGIALAVTRGHSAPEVGETYERILALSERTGKTPSTIYFGLWNLLSSRGELRRARELAHGKIREAEESRDLEALILGLFTKGCMDQYLGDLKGARATYERLLSVYPESEVGTSNDYDIRATALASLGDVLWITGHPDQARQTCDEAVSLARKMSPRALSVALLMRMILACSMRDAETSLACARELSALSREHSYDIWTVFCDLVEAVRGTTEASGIDQALESAVRAVEIMRTVHGSSIQCTRYLAWIAEFALDHGRAEKAGRLLAEALALAERTEERYWEAELHRLRGRLAGDPREAEACFEKALSLAREREEKTFELRAAEDLRRLATPPERSPRG
ncbi:MAG TPA: protein kinase [Thermoanaerobaculia bacterium]|nr:protein kinase [Thermoanaerobaculia bacterium]